MPATTYGRIQQPEYNIPEGVTELRVQVGGRIGIVEALLVGIGIEVTVALKMGAIAEQPTSLDFSSHFSCSAQRI